MIHNLRYMKGREYIVIQKGMLSKYLEQMHLLADLNSMKMMSIFNCIILDDKNKSTIIIIIYS